MVAMAYAWLFLSHLSLVASLAPGDCTFVENGEDFALVLKEDVNGETLSLTEHPISGDFVKKFFVAKKHVSAAKKGTVLKKADFETSFMAPTFLTVFTGSATDPTPLCSINLAKNGVGNKLPDDVKIIIQDIRALMSFGLGALLCCWARSRELKSRDHVDPLERIQLFAFMM